jgi:hypothetical protein
MPGVWGMAYDLQVDPERRLVIVSAYGVFDEHDWADVDRRTRSDPRIEPEFDQLVDVTNVSKAQLAASTIREDASQEPFFSTKSRRAIIAPGDATFGMARMFELWKGGRAGEIRVFRDRAEALAWLAPLE